jgi:hypothetical protein
MPNPTVRQDVVRLQQGLAHRDCWEIVQSAEAVRHMENIEPPDEDDPEDGTALA